jgi:5-(carboxyamino)imidazole ribonucleotide synthase
MLSVAASRLGYRTHIFEPGAAPAAADVSAAWTQAGYDDLDALRPSPGPATSSPSSSRTSPPTRSMSCRGRRPLYPDRRALEVSQDRLTEKRFLTDLGLTTAPFAPIDGPAGDLPPRSPRPARPRS